MPVEEVEVVEGNAGAEVGGVAGCDVEGAGADVAGVDGEGGELPGKSDGDAAAAGADIENGAGWRGRSDSFGGPFDELLRLGAGDQDIVVNIKTLTGEPAFPKNILNRAMGKQLAAIDIILFQGMFRKEFGAANQAVHFPVTGEVLHNPVGHQCRFAAAIEWRQIGSQLSLRLPEIHSVKIVQFA